MPYDPASRRLFGVPIVATVSEAAGVGHVLATDAVVVDTDTQGVGVQWSENSNADDFSKNLIRAVRFLRLVVRFLRLVVRWGGREPRRRQPPHRSHQAVRSQETTPNGDRTELQNRPSQRVPILGLLEVVTWGIRPNPLWHRCSRTCAKPSRPAGDS